MARRIKFEEYRARMRSHLIYTTPTDDYEKMRRGVKVNEENNYEEVGPEACQANKAEGSVPKPEDFKVDVEKV